MSVAENDETRFGYPWLDRTTGVLTVSVVTASAEGVVQQWLRTGVTRTGAKRTHIDGPETTVQVRHVKHSYAALEYIKNDATYLVASGVPDSDAVWATESDHKGNRVIISIDRMSDALLAALASRYGTEAIAVRVERRGQAVELRHADGPPFYGGAILNIPAQAGAQATSGFSWTDNSSNYMFTAGHNGPSGGTYSTPYPITMGTVAPSSRENWNPGTGTVPFTGQSVNRGDLSLITVTAAGGATGRIYVGTASSHASRPVKEMWWGPPTANDQFCTGGAFNGEICGFSVTAGRIRFNIQYASGNWARGVTEGVKSGFCPDHGDSGGPVYTVRPDLGIAAKGIISAKDQTFSWDPCKLYFTDMDLAYYGVPGWLMTQ